MTELAAAAAAWAGQLEKIRRFYEPLLVERYDAAEAHQVEEERRLLYVAMTRARWFIGCVATWSAGPGG